MDELDLVATAGFAVGREAGPGICFGIDLEGWGFVVVPWTVEAVVFVGGEIVVVEDDL